MLLSPSTKTVVTHSSGNHAQALALAAQQQGLQAQIVMPNTSPIVKRNAVEGYGANVVLCEPTLAAREGTAADVLAKANAGCDAGSEPAAVLIPPYNHPHVIAGQGTMALELLEEVPNLDALIVPIGGGGMISGVCLAAKGINPSIRIFSAEPAGADDAAKSMQAGEFVPQLNPQTVADGLKTSMGDLTWPIVKANVERVFTVTDEEIVTTMKLGTFLQFVLLFLCSDDRNAFFHTGIG